MKRAYCIYSKYKVGACIVDSNNNVYLGILKLWFIGCNVENSSYGLTICAERNAIC